MATSVEAPPGAPRICICGAGVAGLTLAGILSKRLDARAHITVFERAPADYDQGYGLDLDCYGQEALARAGVYHRYWDISRERSDCFKVMPLKGSKPLAIFFRPRLLQKMWPSWWGARPESNRGKLREVLLEAMADRPNVEIHFESPARELREVCHDGRTAVEILDEADAVLGQYDLVIDAMGLHSTLRHHVVNDKEGKHYTGSVALHGVINDPEAVFPQELLDRFGSFGTYVVFGKGYGIAMQRFGGGVGDNRTSLFYTVPDRADGEASLFEEIGIEKPSSRKSGIISDAESLDKVKSWIKHDMADHFDPLYHQLVDCLDRITIRGEYSHGDSTLREDVTLPLLCVGDSLRNCGLGGGGILAMQDAIELAKLLEAEGAFDASGQPDMKPLRAAQHVMLQRKAEHIEQKDFRAKLLKTRDGKDPSLHLKDFVPNVLARIPLRIFLSMVTGLFKCWYRWDQFQGQVGSTSSSPIYPNVKMLL